MDKGEQNQESQIKEELRLIPPSMKDEYTKYEKARIIGARALQIAMGAPLILKLSKSELERLSYSPVKIAKLEFEKGVIPLTIKRPSPKKVEEEKVID